ncbi:hypothetical protein T8T21_01080 [Limimaricola variabilis]|uniref:hypothetical protein n=1 Tax=Limimaricola variabilis TaxID=1492771 RepID=UPI002AC98BAA|nr:hypothetical protein [Limimaricola variabilis]WPY94748.1 hypothetical protein T8T21_01080 [Limimaricola variabilis]
MKNFIGIGTALTLALAPMAIEAKPKLKINGNAAAMLQLLDANAGDRAKKAAKIEKKLRKAAKKAGVPLAVGAGTAVAVQQVRAPAAERVEAVVRYAPETVGQRPRLRPETASFATLDTPAEAPPVTTLQDGRRIETSELGSRPTRDGARVTSTTTASAGPTVITIEGDRVSTSDSAFSGTTTTRTSTVAAEPASVTAPAQTVSLETDSSLFGGPTGY